MPNTSIHILIILGCLALHASSQCCVKFYTGANLGGKSFQLCSTGDVPSQYNDLTASFTVPDSCSVLLYADYGGQGASFGPYPTGSYNVDPSFTKTLSSVDIASENYNANCATFYTQANLLGNSFQVCGLSNVPGQYNDKAASFSVPSGLAATLYQNYGRQGAWVGPYAYGLYNMPSVFQGQLSSVGITSVHGTDCPIFYVDFNWQNSNFQQCTSGDIPSNFLGQMSSVNIPPSFKVTFYTGSGATGTSLGPYTQGKYNFPASLNDKLTSIVISRL